METTLIVHARLHACFGGWVPEAPTKIQSSGTRLSCGTHGKYSVCLPHPLHVTRLSWLIPVSSVRLDPVETVARQAFVCSDRTPLHDARSGRDVRSRPSCTVLVRFRALLLRHPVPRLETKDRTHATVDLVTLLIHKHNLLVRIGSEQILRFDTERIGHERDPSCTSKEDV